MNVAAPVIIDVYPCGATPDGATLYGSPAQALAAGVISMAVRYPCEMGHLLVLGAVAGLCWYYASEAFRCDSPCRYGEKRP